MTTRRFLFVDESLVGAPTDAAFKPEGYARINSDGELYVVQSGAYVKKGGSGGGSGALLAAESRPDASVGHDGDFCLYYDIYDALRLLGPKASGAWPATPYGLSTMATVAVDVSSGIVLGADFSGMALELTGSAAQVVTVPNLPIDDSGQLLTFQLDRIGTGAVTIDPDSGTTINGGTATLTMGPQYTSVVLRQLASGGWLATGVFT